MVKKLSFILILIFGAFFLIKGDRLTADKDEEAYQLEIGHVEWKNRPLKIAVEVADNRVERAIGLMYRTELAAGRGMLLQYQDEKILRVWMKDMQFPLDVIFLSATGEIVSVLKNLPPCRQESCDIFSSEAVAKYMLEVNAGFIEKNAVKVGENLLFFL